MSRNDERRKLQRELSEAEAKVEEMSLKARACERGLCHKCRYDQACTNKEDLQASKELLGACKQAVITFNKQQLACNKLVDEARIQRRIDEKPSKRKVVSNKPTSGLTSGSSKRVEKTIVITAPEVKRERVVPMTEKAKLTLTLETHNQLVSEGKTAQQIAVLCGKTKQQVYQQRSEWRKAGLDVAAGKTGAPKKVDEVLTEVQVKVKESSNTARDELLNTTRNVLDLLEMEKGGEDAMTTDKKENILLEEAQARIEKLINENSGLKVQLREVNEENAKLKFELSKQTEAPTANGAAVKTLQSEIDELKASIGHKDIVHQKDVQELKEAYELLELELEGAKEALAEEKQITQIASSNASDVYKTKYEKLAPIAKVLLEDFAAQL